MKIKQGRFSRLNPPPCPKCYKPMTSGVCESKGCQIANARE